MSEQNLLSIGFLDREPRSAARALENIEPRNAAAFLDHVPVRLAAPAVGAMVPWYAARCLEQMDPQSASLLVMGMSHIEAVSILRLVGSSARHEILSHASKRFTRGFRKAVAYRRDTIGAWMDVSTPAFDVTSNVGDALRVLRRMQIDQSHLFVTDSNRQYVGAVSVLRLLHHDESAILDSITNRSIRPLSNQAPLVDCSSSSYWDELNILPVVGRRQNLLGGLRKADMRKGLSQPTKPGKVLDQESILAQMASAFITVVAECANLTFSTHHDRASSRLEE